MQTMIKKMSLIVPLFRLERITLMSHTPGRKIYDTDNTTALW